VRGDGTSGGDARDPRKVVEQSKQKERDEDMQIPFRLIRGDRIRSKSGPAQVGRRNAAPVSTARGKRSGVGSVLKCKEEGQ